MINCSSQNVLHLAKYVHATCIAIIKQSISTNGIYFKVNTISDLSDMKQHDLGTDCHIKQETLSPFTTFKNYLSSFAVPVNIKHCCLKPY